LINVSDLVNEKNITIYADEILIMPNKFYLQPNSAASVIVNVSIIKLLALPPLDATGNYTGKIYVTYNNETIVVPVNFTIYIPGYLAYKYTQYFIKVVNETPDDVFIKPHKRVLMKLEKLIKKHCHECRMKDLEVKELLILILNCTKELIANERYVAAYAILEVIEKITPYILNETYIEPLTNRTYIDIYKTIISEIQNYLRIAIKGKLQAIIKECLRCR